MECRPKIYRFQRKGMSQTVDETLDDLETSSRVIVKVTSREQDESEVSSAEFDTEVCRDIRPSINQSMKQHKSDI